MAFVPENPLIVQGDRSVLLEAANPQYEPARDALVAFAELEKSPEHVHTYRISPLSLWNAAATGRTATAVLDDLTRFSKYDLPGNIVHDIRDYMSRYGRLKLLREGDTLVLRADDPLLITEILHSKKVVPYLARRIDAHTVQVNAGTRGHLKHALVDFGYPAEDLAGYAEGDRLTIAARARTRGDREFALRQYQREAVDVFWAAGGSKGGSGVVVLPCGAGKTVVAIGTIVTAQCHTLIVCYGTTAVHQWIHEILDKTDIERDAIGEYTGDLKEIKPITVTTYQVLTYHPRQKKASAGGARAPKHGGGQRGGEADDRGVLGEEFPHLGLFTSRNWGLIVYDEVHLLPAPVFRVTAEIQARRRLGLTATLVREDGREDEVFSLIGPKKFDLPWKSLERQGWIATAECWEVRVALPADQRLAYATAPDNRVKYRVAAENPAKMDVLDRLIAMHERDNILIIGQYLEQLRLLADRLDAPLITGQLPHRDRERLYAEFRTGAIKRLVVSKVANFAIDLPDANVAIQVSGTFGSRQEEAQRLGRILRPKEDGGQAHFYSIITRDTNDQEYAARRQLFLTEQGYRYTILDATELIARATVAAGNH